MNQRRKAKEHLETIGVTSAGEGGRQDRIFGQPVLSVISQVLPHKQIGMDVGDSGRKSTHQL